MYPVFHLFIRQILIERQLSASSGEKSGNELRKGIAGGGRASGHLGWAAGGGVSRQRQGQASGFPLCNPSWQMQVLSQLRAAGLPNSATATSLRIRRAGRQRGTDLEAPESDRAGSKACPVSTVSHLT